MELWILILIAIYDLLINYMLTIFNHKMFLGKISNNY